MKQDQVVGALRELLSAQPHQDKRRLRKGLRQLGMPDWPLSDLNSLLYTRRDLFAHDSGTPPRWHLLQERGGSDRTLGQPAPPWPSPALYGGRPPRTWQIQALQAWTATGRCGVVEAVTGTGKTTVGVLAAAQAIERGEKVVILVPTRELMRQWYKVLTRDLHHVSIGRLGDGHEDEVSDHEVVVAVVHSASRRWLLPPTTPGLLIADEVHRYGALTFARALEPAFGARLGLTATYEREDNGVAEYLEPYFGDVIAGCSYERGLADGILASFRVGLVPVEFTDNEREQYQELNEVIGPLHHRLVHVYGCPSEPYGEFMKSVSALQQGGNDDSRMTMDARRYLSATSKRRQLLADSARKLDALTAMVPMLHAANGGLVFTETVASAVAAADRLRFRGLQAAAFTSKLNGDDRGALLRAFERGAMRVLAAPRILDEGIDVPQADVGVIVAASRSRRQMIQRMGRVIRPKADGRSATFLITFVTGTSEDPKAGAHGAFLEQLTDVAEDVYRFPDGMTALTSWAGRARELCGAEAYR